MGIHIISVRNHKSEFTSLPWYHFQQEQVLAHSFSSSFKRTVQYIATNTPSAVFASKVLHFQEFLLYELCMDSSSVTCWSHSVCRVTIQKQCLHFSRFGDLVKYLIRFLCFLVTSSLGMWQRAPCTSAPSSGWSLTQPCDSALLHESLVFCVWCLQSKLFRSRRSSCRRKQ